MSGAPRHHVALGRRSPAKRHARNADVRIVEAQTVRGGVVLIALSRSDPGSAYVLETGGQGQPICPCPGYSFRGTCAHVEALFREQSIEAVERKVPA